MAKIKETSTGDAILDDESIRKYALQLSKEPISQQIQALSTGPYANNSLAAVKLGLQLVNLLQKATENSHKENAQFLQLCQTTSEAIKKSIADGKLTPEEEIHARDQLMKVLETAEKNMDKARQERSSNVQTAVVAASVAGTLGLVLMTIFAKGQSKK